MTAVSVVIATYRRPQQLLRAVRTVLAQTMTDLEIVVVVERDDMESPMALETIDDPRLRHAVNPEKLGPGVARDYGVAASGGTYIAFLDDDDEWLPSKLEKQLAAGGGDLSTIVTTLSRVVTPVGDLVQPARPYAATEAIDEWLFGRRTWLKGGESMLQTSSLLIPRELMRAVRFGGSLHEEWEFAIRSVKERGCRLVTVPEILVVYYTGMNFYSWRGSIDWIRSMRTIVSSQAYAGFCLTVVSQGVNSPGRNRAFLALLREAVVRGRPTAKQFFAFALLWAVPRSLRQRLRIASRKWRLGRQSVQIKHDARAPAA